MQQTALLQHRIPGCRLPAPIRLVTAELGGLLIRGSEFRLDFQAANCSLFVLIVGSRLIETAPLMNQQLRAYLDEQAKATDDDMRQAVELAGGDVVHALRITLIANQFLVEENERLKAQISKGFTRGKCP